MFMYNNCTNRGRNTCGISSPTPKDEYSAYCTKWGEHMQHGPCQNSSAKLAWCFVCDSFDCLHMRKWRRSGKWEIETS